MYYVKPGELPLTSDEECAQIYLEATTNYQFKK